MFEAEANTKRMRTTKAMQTDATAGLTDQWPPGYRWFWRKTSDYESGAADCQAVRRHWKGRDGMNPLLKVAGLAIGATLIMSCAGDESGDEHSEGPVAKVAVFADGRITLDDEDASISDVKARFQELAGIGGTVWYYRADATGEPHRNAMLVVEAVVEAQLPMSLSSKPDFSDVVLPDGTTRPR